MPRSKPEKPSQSTLLLLLERVESFAFYLSHGRNASQHTVVSYRRDLTQFVAWLQAEQLVANEADWNEVSYLMIRRYLGHLSGQDYNRASVVRKLSCLKSFFKWLEREEIVSGNPAAQVLSPRLSRLLPDVLSLDEVEAMLALPDTSTPFGLRDRALLEVLYASGMRVAEASALSMGDVDWALARKSGGEGQLRVRQGKGGKERIALLGRAAVEALEEYVRRGRADLMVRRKSTSAPVSDAVWINGRGTRLSGHAIYMLVQAYAERAGIRKNVTPHTLRHSFATHLREGGADLRVIQELLGHRSLSSTQLYTRISAGHLKRAYDTAHPRASIED